MKLLAIIISFFVSISLSFAQSIPSDRVVENGDLQKLLKEEVQTNIPESNNAALAKYFREKFRERYFYDYKTFDERLNHYNSVFKSQESHKERALDHIGKYNDSTQWVLPFNYQNGEPVNAYALRHLARQHKMVDIALYYFNEGKDSSLIQYFTNQMRSLNSALSKGEFEKIEDGNGVYEAFRSGYRILNWLWIHNMFLNESEYSDRDQLVTIATLLQHGQHLYERNQEFKYGNHQTRGVSALAMLAILFPDFEGTDLWLETALDRLNEHLEKEINEDGFQFERSIHYHMSDINNYFYVYQLAKINSIEIGETLEDKLEGLFSTLVKVAYPDRSAPVLQDDTEIPWAEKNDISGAMTLGYLLFEDPEYGYFATDKVDDRVYWFLSGEQIESLKKIKQTKPTYGSLVFEETGYYVMREGWNPNDKMMVISAGLDKDKPDHQHGDMLGVQAIANGHAILPNYQVRYSLKDFDVFKNSMVKNVALVGNQLQGKKWKSNKGGSGFGKFGELPEPFVITWDTNKDFDLFVGSHDGFEDVGVEYSRQVIYVKDDFWIVKDNFRSDEPNEYKQVWQGHYTLENGPDLIRATMSDASGHDIIQLTSSDTVYNSGTRGKHWAVVSKSEQKDFSFISIIYPYKGYNNRIDEESQELTIEGWKLNEANLRIEGTNPISISTDNQIYLFGIKEFSNEKIDIKSDTEVDLYVIIRGDEIHIQSIDEFAESVTFSANNKDYTQILKPGELWKLKIE